MNILLTSALRDTLIPMVVLFLILLIGFIIIYGLKRVLGKDRGMITKSEPRIINVDIKKAYLEPKEVEFLKNIVKILPDEFVVFPKVGVDNLVQPRNDKVLYNTILSQYCDICIFLKNTMQPVLAIDLYQATPSAQHMKQLHPNVSRALKAVNLPLITYRITNDGYDLDDLRQKVLEAMPAEILAIVKGRIVNKK